MIKNTILASSLLFTSLCANNIDEDKFEMGEKIYNETCVSCHGKDGKAHTNMKLIIKPRDLTLTLLDEEQIYNITKDGAHKWGAKADIMPAFKYTYNEEQLRSVTHYVYHHFNPNLKQRIKALLDESEPESTTKPKKMAKWGKKIFKRNCKFCHGLEGKGDGVATTSPVDSIFPYDLTRTLLTKDQIFLYVKYGGQHFGTDKDDMPSWKKKYNDFRLHSITRYIDEIIRTKK